MLKVRENMGIGSLYCQYVTLFAKGVVMQRDSNLGIPPFVMDFV